MGNTWIVPGRHMEPKLEEMPEGIGQPRGAMPFSAPERQTLLKKSLTVRHAWDGADGLAPLPLTVREAERQGVNEGDVGHTTFARHTADDARL